MLALFGEILLEKLGLPWMKITFVLVIWAVLESKLSVVNFAPGRGEMVKSSHRNRGHP